MICPECQHYMREYIDSYRCINCGAVRKKCKIPNVSPIPVDSKTHRRGHINLQGFFWILYFALLIMGFVFFLFWLQKQDYTIFLGGILDGNTL